MAACTALLLAACGEQGAITGSSDGPGVSADMHVPTAANDGLLERDLSGVTADDFVTAGVGTASGDVETIEVDVPSGATVEAVFLYWARRDDENAPAPAEIEVEGSTVTGSVIGGPVDTPDDEDAGISFRADVTSLGLVGPGTSSFEVQDDPAAPAEPLGASVLVFYSTSGASADLALFDGVDFIWAEATAPDADQQEALRTAVPVTFEFDPSDVSRSAELVLFVGDVDDPERPNSLEITVGEASDPTETLGPEPSVFQAFEGDEWDNFVHAITVPAGVEQVTVEPVSGPGEDPASLVWSLAALSVEAPPAGGEGCTPGFWRQEHHFDSWEGHAPGDDLASVFDIPSDLELQRPETADPEDLTLLEGLELRGGGVNALVRHAVAALLNAASGDVDFDLTESEVVEAFNAAVDGGDVEGTKDALEAFNEQGCPLD